MRITVASAGESVTHVPGGARLKREISEPSSQFDRAALTSASTAVTDAASSAGTQRATTR